MRIPSTSSLALRLHARQVIATTALLWRLPATASTQPHTDIGRPTRRTGVWPRLQLKGFAL